VGDKTCSSSPEIPAWTEHREHDCYHDGRCNSQSIMSEGISTAHLSIDSAEHLQTCLFIVKKQCPKHSVSSNVVSLLDFENNMNVEFCSLFLFQQQILRCRFPQQFAYTETELDPHTHCFLSLSSFW
jgi:hypothetical protein